MLKTEKFFKISSLLLLGQLIASEGFAQVTPVTNQRGQYYECDNQPQQYCVNDVCGDACFCNIESQYGNSYGTPYNVCWVDMNSKKEVNCKEQNNLYFEEKGVRNPLCREYK